MNTEILFGQIVQQEKNRPQSVSFIESQTSSSFNFEARIEAGDLDSEKMKKYTNVDFKQRIMKKVAFPIGKVLPTSQVFLPTGKPNIKAITHHLVNEGRLRKEDFLTIIKMAREVYRKERNLLDLQDPITVCGDIHGQYYDLCRLFKIGGEPGDPKVGNTSYLFLGDYVDRGCFGCECVITLFCYKILHPYHFYMIRGNHECRHLSSYFNFKEECCHKYSKHIYDEIMNTFDCLPLGAILNRRFFCVHGGISPSCNKIDDILAVKRFREPPSSGLMCDLLWADPMDEKEEVNVGDKQAFVQNKLRGCSYCYSYKAVMTFLKNNKLLSVIRAHEAQDEGYKLFKKSEESGFPSVICIFSAPNYCDAYGNKGAIIRFNQNLMNIRQFNNSAHPYYLPHFMNAFNWSLPFVIDKTLDLFKIILSLAIPEKPEEKDEEVSNLDRMLQTRRAARVKKKIEAVVRYRLMYKTLMDHSKKVEQLKGLAGGAIPKGILTQGERGISIAIGDFSLAKENDIDNEKRPPLTRELHFEDMEVDDSDDDVEKTDEELAEERRSLIALMEGEEGIKYTVNREPPHFEMDNKNHAIPDENLEDEDSKELQETLKKMKEKYAEEERLKMLKEEGKEEQVVEKKDDGKELEKVVEKKKDEDKKMDTSISTFGAKKDSVLGNEKKVLAPIGSSSGELKKKKKKGKLKPIKKKGSNL